LTTEAELKQAQADLRRLSRMLGTFEIAKDLVDTYGMETVGEALSMVEAANAENEDPGPATIQGAMKIANEAGEPWRAKPIQLGKNRSVVKFNGVSAKPDAPVKKFNQIVNKSTSDFARLTAEDRDELPWKRRDVSASKLRVIKDAVLRSQETKKKCVEEHQAFSVNETAMSILKAHTARKALQEGNNTSAARTIVANGTPTEKSVKDMLPPSWKNSNEVPTLPVERDINTQNALPDDFKPKIEKTEDRSFGAQAARTKAAATIARPVASKGEIPNPETNDQGEVADKYYAAGKSRPIFTGQSIPSAVVLKFEFLP
jgi:hypothetical protein